VIGGQCKEKVKSDFAWREGFKESRISCRQWSPPAWFFWINWVNRDDLLVVNAIFCYTFSLWWSLEK